VPVDPADVVFWFCAALNIAIAVALAVRFRASVKAGIQTERKAKTTYSWLCLASGACCGVVVFGADRWRTNCDWLDTPQMVNLGEAFTPIFKRKHAQSLMRLAALALLLLGFVQAHAEQRGKVYMLVNPQEPRDQWQRRPLPGVFVALSWTHTIPAPTHAITTCSYSELARSDDTGEYVVEGPNPVTASLASVSYYVYFPGLQPIAYPYGGSPMSPKDITMAFSTRTPAARLSQLALFTDPGCGDGKLSDPRALFVPYLRALLEEAKTLTVDSDRGRADIAHIDAVLRGATKSDRPQSPRAVVLPGGTELRRSNAPK
jgi:hypothetical protein